MNLASCNLRIRSGWFILLLMSVMSAKMVHATGTRGSDPTGTSESSSAYDTDGDGLADNEDADPNGILVNWAKTPEFSYMLMDVDAPFAESGPYDINDQGEILFTNGIWSAGNWIPLLTQPGVAGSFPNGDGTDQNYFVTFDPTYYFDGYRHFDDNHNLAGMNAIILPGPGDFVVPSAFKHPHGQSAQDLAVAELLPTYISSSYSLRLHGMNASQTVVARLAYSEGNEIRTKLVLFPPNGASPIIRDLPGGTRFRNSFYNDNFVSASGWITCHTQGVTTGNGNGTALWNPQGAAMALPEAASNGFAMLHLSDLPKGKNPANGESASLVAANINGSSQVLIPDMEGQMQCVDSMSDKNLKILSPDGTGMTSDSKMWINGELIPLSDLCPNFGELLAQGWTFKPLKANKHGVYLLEAINPAGISMGKLLQPVRFNLRNHADYAKGWDNTADVRTPWTSCGTGKTNSIIGVTIPGCTEEMGNLLELVQHVPEAGDTYVTLENQSIHGVETRFDIKGLGATPANGCQIIVRQKTNHSNRSNALNVYVFPPRVVKFQVYRAFPTENPEPGFVPTWEQIKNGLNTTYNEQANIRFEALQENVINVNNITGVFDAQGNLSEEHRGLLVQRINDFNENRDPDLSRHLKIIIIDSLNPDKAGIADYLADWIIVKASVSQLDTYSHETGHSFNLASKAPPFGQRHEAFSAKAPNGGVPHMRGPNAATRWIRQEDWKLSNAEAANTRYGN